MSLLLVLCCVLLFNFCFIFFLTLLLLLFSFFFFFNDTATTEIYTLSLHDALPICLHENADLAAVEVAVPEQFRIRHRSEEHTSELQSQSNLVCRLLLEKKKKKNMNKQQQNRSQEMQKLT